MAGLEGRKTRAQDDYVIGPREIEGPARGRSRGANYGGKL